MEWTYVFKDKGTHNQGWWLKITSIDELAAYYEAKNPVRYGKVMENYLYGKEFNKGTGSHAPHQNEISLTQAVIMHGQKNNQTIWQAISSFELMVAEQQMKSLREDGAIYINPLGGYHGAYEGEPEYDTVVLDSLDFPPKDYKIGKLLPKTNAQTSEFVYGWLSPMGDFYEADWSRHEDKAQELCARLGIDDNNDLESRTTLSNLGWVLIHDPSNAGKCDVTHIKPLTKRQEDFLYGYFADRGLYNRAETYIDNNYER